MMVDIKYENASKRIIADVALYSGNTDDWR